MRLTLLLALSAICAMGSICAALSAETLSIDVGGLQRSALMERPATQSPLPALIMLHGAGGNAATLDRLTGLGQLAAREGFVAVFPESIARFWNDGRPEHAEFLRQRGALGDDAAFIAALVTDLVKRGIADPRRIFIAGFSNGGLMALRMACTAPGLFAGAGAISGSVPLTPDECRPSASLSLVLMNGTADPVMPYAGGRVGQGRGASQGSVWGTDRTLEVFRQADGCAGDPANLTLPGATEDATPVTVQQWSQCAAGTVLLYRIEGGGNRIPGSLAAGPGLDATAGRKAMSFSAGLALWSFFRDKSRP